MNNLHKIWVTLSTTTIPRRNSKGDNGASFVEYAGLLVIIALIASFIVGLGLEVRISQGIMSSINRILGGS